MNVSGIAADQVILDKGVSNGLLLCDDDDQQRLAARSDGRSTGRRLAI